MQRLINNNYNSSSSLSTFTCRGMQLMEFNKVFTALSTTIHRISVYKVFFRFSNPSPAWEDIRLNACIFISNIKSNSYLSCMLIIYIHIWTILLFWHTVLQEPFHISIHATLWLQAYKSLIYYNKIFIVIIMDPLLLQRFLTVVVELCLPL